MEVGDYVKIKKGEIGKIKIIDNQTELYDLYLIKNHWYKKEDIVKSAEGTPKGLLSLIEVGDYVNGCMVVNKKDDIIQIIQIMIPFDLKEKDIKSIVTREMFESMEYRIGDENE